MANITRQVKKHINELQADYMGGFLSYPRVENDYIAPENAFELIPHKPLFPQYNDSLAPILNKSLPLNKNNILLFLSQKRLISPSQAENYAKSIDEYFNDDLQYLSEEKKAEIDILYDLMATMLEEKNVLNTEKSIEDNILEKHSRIFDENKKNTNIAFYSIKTMKFFPNIDGSSKKRRTPKEVEDSLWYKKYVLKKKKEKKEDTFVEVSYMAECLELFMKLRQRNIQNQAIQNFETEELKERTAKKLEKYIKKGN